MTPSTSIAEEANVALAEADCFHCGEPIPPNFQYSATVDDLQRAMCCPGCAAVASLIVESGLGSFYSQRTAYNERPPPVEKPQEENRLIYDSTELNSAFARPGEGDLLSARLLLGGLTCAACTWLVEHTLSRLPGVATANVNLSQHCLDVSLHTGEISLGQIVQRIEALGYSVQPFHYSAQKEQFDRQRTTDLRRLAVAGIGMMQVGMFAIALHAGDLQGMAREYRDLMRWVSVLFTAVVVMYSARGFFETAWKHLQQRALVMDLPVAIAIGLAFSASVWATINGSGQVYFDSVVMFTFLLLLGRFIEGRSRQKLALIPVDVDACLPTLSQRWQDEGWQYVAREQLQIEDLVLVKPGATIPVDGSIIRGSGQINQASIDGEQTPRSVRPGDLVYAGTLSLDGSLEIRVAIEPAASRLAALQRCLDGARTAKPQLAKLADQVATHFIKAILLISLATASYYWYTAPEQALWICLSVLVVSCPCALALGTPAALSAATNRLLRLGILIRSENALETLARVTHVIFDKTGTLTSGKFVLADLQPLGALERHEILSIAAGLQTYSNHPLAAVFHDFPAHAVDNCEQITGAGVSGFIEGVEFRMGSESFCRQLQPQMPEPPPGDHYWIGLCSALAPLAWLGLHDPVRPEARAVVSALQARSLDVRLLTGDVSAAGPRMARELGIDICEKNCPPQGKLDYVDHLQKAGAVVAMVGDGLNDAPVLKGASVSFAVAGATDLARAEADIVIDNDSLEPLLLAVNIARACRRIIKQNLAWAVAYNLCAIPLAVAGLVPPWMAAIGMSASSLLVVINSLRLSRWQPSARNPRRG
ncbi:MAG: Cu2+-exporting ATPase [Halieaceae bacterium]|jgi:Cu2+-exporting ATPase